MKLSQLSVMFLLSGGLVFAGHKYSKELESATPESNVDVIITFKQLPTDANHRRVLARGGNHRGTFANISGAAYTIPAAALQDLDNDDSVLHISVDHKVKPRLDYVTAAINAASAWNSSPSITGSGIGVAVVDSGFTATPDLSNSSIVFNKSFLSQGSIATNAYYQVINQATGACVDDSGGGTGNGTILQQWSCNSGNLNQQWLFTSLPGGYYRVSSRNMTSLSWDVTASGTTPGTPMELWSTSPPGTNEQIQAILQANGYYELIDRNSGMCLNVPGGSTSSGVQLQMNTCNGSSSEMWTLNLSAGDAYGHGQHIAGIIASSGAGCNGSTCLHTIKGVAPGVNLINLQVLDANGEAQDSTVIAAINTAIQLKNTYNIRVINLSLGRPVFESYQQDPLCQAVEAAWKAGIVVVVAAGNEGRDNAEGNQGYGTINSPGNDPYVITVGAMKTNGTYGRSDDTVASYSSKGPSLVDNIVKPDIVAPGNQVVSLLPQSSTMPTLAANYPANLVPVSYYNPSAASSAASASLAIRCGAGGTGNFTGDEYYSGGGTSTFNNIINVANVANAAPLAVYQAERVGVFTYTIPNLVPGAGYILRLHFAEMYWSKPGQRVFNVNINGTPALSNFDIVATAGANTPVVRTFAVNANGSGNIVINFLNGPVDQPKVSGIEVVPTSNSLEYYMLSGTSMSAGVVSGAAALVLQAHPSYTPDQVKIKLMKNAYKTFPTQSTAVDTVSGQTFVSYYDVFTVGAGYLDVAATLADTSTPPSGNSLSPVAAFNSSNSEVTVTYSSTSAWANSGAWGAKTSASSAAWGASLIATDQSVVGGNSAAWGASSAWGASGLFATSANSAQSSLWSSSSAWGASASAGASSAWGAGTEQSDSKPVEITGEK